MQWSPLRLVQKRWKAAYLVGGYAVVWVLFRIALLALELDSIAYAGFAAVIDFVWIYFATRVFRGSDELILPPRPWWRMTARPRAGFLLGALFALFAAFNVGSVVRGDEYAALWVASIVEYGVLATLYVVSSIRLRKRA